VADHPHNPATDRRGEEPGRRAVDDDTVQKATEVVNSARLAALEKLAADYARMARDSSMKRISAKISYLIAGLAMAVTIALFFANQNRLEEQTAANRATIVRIEKESADRRNQNCEILEKQHLESVRSLKLTYNYLGQLSPAERHESLNRLILAQLGQTERDAVTSVAPDYCYEKGVGLATPKPKMPERPPALTKFVQEAKS
jgi:hypothetical protein